LNLKLKKGERKNIQTARRASGEDPTRDLSPRDSNLRNPQRDFPGGLLTAGLQRASAVTPGSFSLPSLQLWKGRVKQWKGGSFARLDLGLGLVPCQTNPLPSWAYLSRCGTGNDNWALLRGRHDASAFPLFLLASLGLTCPMLSAMLCLVS
jgi:hypothetical protein